MRREKDHSLNGLLALLLFGIFAACVLSVLLMGADAYQRLTERDRESYESRTVAQYIATRVRQADRSGGVSVGAFGGSDALELWEPIDGEAYVTRVYCHDGWLRELFAAEEDPFAPEDGEKILPALGLELRDEGELLRLELTDSDGQVIALTLCPRGGEGGLS